MDYKMLRSMQEHHNFNGTYYKDWYGRKLSRYEALTINDLDISTQEGLEKLKKNREAQSRKNA